MESVIGYLPQEDVRSGSLHRYELEFQTSKIYAVCLLINKWYAHAVMLYIL